MAGIIRSFGPTHALRGVDLQVDAREVHALIGENGAGKSTLMKVLSGAHRPDAGTMTLDGKPFRPRDPWHARRLGVSMIYQELTLAPHLSVLENLLLGIEPARLGWIDGRQSRETARSALSELGHPDLPLDEPVYKLPISLQQIVEIARSLITEPRVLVMDEPTSSLGQADAQRLFETIRRLKGIGVSVIYISHFLEECEAVCDRYTVLRDGKTAATGIMGETSRREILENMVGREVDDIYPQKSHAVRESALKVTDVSGSSKPRHVSLEVSHGEILGIAGLIGAGRTELLRVLFGLDSMPSGDIEIEGVAVSRHTPGQSLEAGVGFLSESRKDEGLLQNRSIADNLTITRFDPVTRFAMISRRRQRTVVGELVERLGIRAADPFQPVRTLSGGNQQKVALGRLLHHDARILLLDEPTRGIDVGSKIEIYQLMRTLADSGKAIVFVSSYLPELLGVCDRIAALCRGELVDIRLSDEWTEQSLIEAAVGGEASP